MLLEQEFSTAILFPGSLIMACFGRAVFAIGDGIDSARLDPESDELFAQR